MTEARRHSVDIPLSRTLVALKRVRSLRDPDTSSLSKIASLVDNMNLETSSCNGAIFRLRDGNKHSFGSKERFPWQRRNADVDTESESDSNPFALGTTAERLANNTQVHDPCNGDMRSPLDLKDAPCLTKHLGKELDYHHYKQFQKLEMIRASSLKQFKNDASTGITRPYSNKDGGVVHNAGIPGAYAVRACANSSYHRSSVPTAEKFDFAFPDRDACDASGCWSRVPKYDDLKLPPHVGDPECQLDRESVYRGSAPFQEITKSLSEKYRPKSFHELVGQNEVSQSLLNAILKGNIAPIYLFHGPRGTGKSSAARIFAAALNCHSCKEHRPCETCQGCMLVLSGTSRDVAELDVSETNHNEWSKVFSEAAHVPVFSRYKVFVIDECHLLQRSAWSAIYKSIEELSRHAVFIMITSDLDKMPSGILSWCQRYQFLKAKNVDIIAKLERICKEEELEFEQDALGFLACESGGSLRDAITMVDQLALLGNRITSSIAYELMGVVSDDELLDLLHLALSSDTSGTVRRARELMSSGIDPIKLTSQLAKLITDILSGGRQSVSARFSAGADTAKLRHALKVLVETEKQLRTSKDQSTWLTAALLQFNTGESFSPNMNAQRTTHYRDDGRLVTSPQEALRSSVMCHHRASNVEAELEDIWRKTIENCQSRSLKTFLRKHGRLTSIHVFEGLAVADVEFNHPTYAERAEESCGLIVTSLQNVLGCNVDARINFVLSSLRTSRRKLAFSLFCCSVRKQEIPDSTFKNTKIRPQLGLRSDRSEFCRSPKRRGREFEPCSSQQKQDPPIMQHQHRSNTDGNNVYVLMNRTPSGKVQDDFSEGCKAETESSKCADECGKNTHVKETTRRPSCFRRLLKFSSRSVSANAAPAIFPKIQHRQKIPSKENVGTNDLCNVCSSSKEQHNYTIGEQNGD